MSHNQLIEDASSISSATPERQDGCAVRNEARDELTHAPGGSGSSSRFPLLTDPVDAASASLFEENLRRGAKPRAEWMCGIEFELFG